MESTTSNGHNNNFIYHNENFWESATTAALDKALVKFNAEFKSVKRDELVAVPNRAPRKFASLDEIMIEIRPILAKCGLYVIQPITGGTITTVIRHESSEFRAVSQPMVDWKGQGTTPIQDLGGAITYMRRYALGAALALATEEDDDAQSTGKLTVKKSNQESPTKPTPPPLSQQVIDEWQSKVNECKEPEDFTRLAKELKALNLEPESPLRKFALAAIDTQKEKVGVEFNGETKVYQKKLPTEKQA